MYNINTNYRNSNNDNEGTRPKSFSTVCLNSCRKLLSQLEAIKDSWWAKYSAALHGQEQILRTALNEAEALAWQTPYPHLFFPVLAEEKAMSARRWAARQQMIRNPQWARAFAA